MPQYSKNDQAERRAIKLAGRTFHRTPSVLGQTAQQEPIVEISSVKLALPKNSPHFRRLLRCTRCGRETLGDPVLSTADLHVVESNVLCEDCAMSSVKGPPAPLTRRERPQDATSAMEPRQPAIEVSPGGGAADGPPLAAVDASEAIATGTDAGGRSLSRAGVPLRREAALQALLDRHHSVLVTTLETRFEERLQAVSTWLAESFEARARAIAYETGHLLADAVEQRNVVTSDELRATYAQHLEQGSAELIARVLTAVESRLDDHAQRIRRELEECHQQLASGLAVAVGQRMNDQAQGLLGTVDQRHGQLVSELGATVSTRLEQHGAALSAQLHQRQDELTSTVDQRLKQHAETWAAVLEGREGHLVSELGAGVANRLEEQAKDLLSQLDQRQADLAAELAAAVGQRLRQQSEAIATRLQELSRLVSNVSATGPDRLQEQFEVLIRQLDARQDQVVGDIAGVRQGLEDKIHDLSRMWLRELRGVIEDSLACRAQQAQRLSSDLAGVASELAKLQAELALTRQEVADVRQAVAAVKPAGERAAKPQSKQAAKNIVANTAAPTAAKKIAGQRSRAGAATSAASGSLKAQAPVAKKVTTKKAAKGQR